MAWPSWQSMVAANRPKPTPKQPPFIKGPFPHLGQAVAVGPKPPKAAGAAPAAPGAPASSGVDAAAAAAAAARTSALDDFRQWFAQVGMGMDAELEGVILNAMQQGYTPDQVELLIPDIQNTAVFKQRFPGYAARISNGFNAISLGQYLALEDQYHSIMKSAGLPAGFYDDPSDFGKWIANDVSPAEITERVRLASDAAKRVDPTMRDLMARFYGLSTGDVASYFLDPNRALPVIEHQYKSAEVASWAAKSGYQVGDMKRYEDLMTSGVTGDQAAQGYSTVRQLDDSVGRMASVYGESYDQSDAERDVFFNDNAKRRRIVTQEQATFGGSSQGATGTARRQSY